MDHLTAKSGFLQVGSTYRVTHCLRLSRSPLNRQPCGPCSTAVLRHSVNVDCPIYRTFQQGQPLIRLFFRITRLAIEQVTTCNRQDVDRLRMKIQIQHAARKQGLLFPPKPARLGALSCMLCVQAPKQGASWVVQRFLGDLPSTAPYPSHRRKMVCCPCIIFQAQSGREEWDTIQ